MRRRQIKVEPKVDPKTYGGACLADEAKVITPNEFLMKVERKPSSVNISFNPINPKDVQHQQLMTLYGDRRTLVEAIQSASYLAQGKKPEEEFAREAAEDAKDLVRAYWETRAEKEEIPWQIY